MQQSTTSNPNLSSSKAKTGSSIVPVQVQQSIMEWLDEDLPNDSPARVARALGLPSNAFASASGGGASHGRRGGGNANSSSMFRSSSNRNANNRSMRSTTPGDANNTTTASQNGGGTSSISPTRPARRPGTRRQRQKEHTHVFVENPDLPAIHPANSIWLYGSYEYKLQTSPEEAQRTVFRIISRLVERMQRLLDASTAAAARGDATSKEAVQQAANSAAIDAMMPTLPSTVFAAGAGAGGQSGSGKNNTNTNNNNGGVLPRNHPLQGAVSGGRFRAKGHLVFDLISTRKHITQNFRNGLPYRLGEEIYEHCQRKFVDCIATCFVGLTDNPAQRVGRDIFYQRSDDLSTSHLSFMNIDYGHLFVVFPPDSKRLKETPLPNQNNSNNNSQFGMNTNANDTSTATTYDETNTRFLIDALSGAHDLTGSTIPGRPPPLSSLAATRRQQEEALFKVQQMKQKQMAASKSGGNQNLNNTTGTTADEAANLIAMHRQMFNNTPRRRQVNVQGSNAQKTHVWGSANSSPNNSPSPNARASSGMMRK